MAAFDPRYSASAPGMGVSQESLYADYLRDMFESAASQYDGYTAQPQTRVNYADPQSGLAPGFRRSNDIFQLDPDPFGSQTAALGEGLPASGVTGDSVLALDVFGKRMTREQLQQSDAGRRLLEISERARTGRRRGFFDAITDWSWSDAPFLSLFATVGKSVSDAVTVSDTFRKLQNGEPVTDDELVKTRLYMAEQEERQNGTWGATLGDIVRAAPGFMVEFLASGGLYSAARAGLSKAFGKGTSLVLTGATKKAAREAVETGMRRLVRQGGEAAADRATGALRFFEGVKAVAGDSGKMAKFTDEATETVIEALRGGKMGINPYLTELGRDGAVKFADETAARQIVRNRVLYEIDKMVARNSSEHAVVRGMHQFGQWFQRHAASALLDHGAWGTEEATVLTTGFTKARSALADAAGALFVEAPIRGSLMMAPNALVMKPLLGQVLGQDGRTVSEAELSLRQSAYLQGLKDPEAGRRLMDSAESIASGMNWLEYVSESAGRGFGSLARGVGLWVNRGANAVARGAESTLAGAAADAAYDGFSVGGALRKMWTKAFGTKADFVRRNLDDKVRVVGEALKSAGQRVDESALRRAIMSESADALPAAVQDYIDRSLGKTVTRTATGRVAVGVGKAASGDFNAFVKKTMEDAYDKEGFKALGRFMVSDWMVRHNIGPDTALNLFQRMGYDGMLGEIFEERYSDIAKGAMGWNDRADRDEVKTRVVEAIKGIWPGWEQLTAEAVGFSVPMVSRMAVARIQARLGGEGPLQKLRNRLEMYSDMFRSPITLRAQLGEFLAVRRMTESGLQTRLDDVNARLAKARDAKDEVLAAALEDEAGVVSRTQERYRKASARWFSGMREASRTDYGGRIAAAREAGDEAEVSRLEAERDAIDRTYGKWEGGDYSVEGAARDVLEQLVVIEPLTGRLAETEGIEYTMRPANTSEQSARGMDAAESFVDFSPELAKMLFQLDAPMDGEAPSGLRAVAGRLIGMAGAVISGDFSLVSRDPATWVARDMGVDRQFLRTLKQGFADARRDAREELRRIAREGKVETVAKNFHDVSRHREEEFLLGRSIDDLAQGTRPLDTAVVTEAQVDEKAQELFAGRARTLAREYLAAQQVRTFSRGEMKDRALVLAARRLTPDEGGPYDVIDTDSRQFARLGEDGRIDEGSRIGFDDFYEKYGKDAADADGKVTRKGVDTLTSEIATAAMDLLTNRTSVSTADKRMPVSLVQLPDGADLEQTAVYTAAMQMAGFGNYVAVARLRPDRTLGQTMQEGAVAQVPAPVLRAIAAQSAKPDGTHDASQVEAGLLETVAYSFGLRFDGTAKGLNARNQKIVEIAALAQSMENPNEAWFRLYNDPRGGEDWRTDPWRGKDSGYVLFKATLREDGKWHGTLKEGGGEIVADSVGGMLSRLKGEAANAEILDPRVIFTQQRVIETDSLVDALRALNLTDRYKELTAGNPHPLFAKDADGNWLRTEEDAQAELDRLMALASRTDGEHLKVTDAETGEDYQREEASANAAWQSLYGENGFITVGESLLRDHGVDTWNTLNLGAGFQRSTGKYQMRLAQFMDRGDIYVPVDLTSVADYKEALVDARLTKAYATNPRARDVFAQGCSDFMDELNALCAVKAREADRRGDKPLAAELRDLRKGLFACTSRTALEVQPDGTVKQVDRPAGMDPHTFAQLGHMLCLFGAERLSGDGYGRVPRIAAYAALAEDTRHLPHYTSFMSYVDVTLGGAGFLGEILVPEGEARNDSRGLGGLARLYLNDAKTYGDMFSKLTGVGLSPSDLMEGCNRVLMAMNRSRFEYAPPGKDRRTLRGYGEYGEVLDRISKATGLKGKDLADLIAQSVGVMLKARGEGSFADVVAAVDELGKGPEGGSLKEFVDKYNVAVKSVNEHVAERNRHVQEIKRLEFEQKRLHTKSETAPLTTGENVRLAEIGALLAIEKGKLDEVLAATDALRKAQEENRVALEAEVKKAGTAVVKQATALGGNAFNLFSGRRGGNNIAASEDKSGTAGADNLSVKTDVVEAPNIVNVMYSGTSTLAQGVRMADDGILLGTYLTAKESRAAFSVILRVMLSGSGTVTVTSETVERTMHRMFPGLPAYDRAQIMSVYEDALAGVEGTGKPWTKVADEGFDFTYLEEDKDENEGADTSSENQQIARRAVDELSNEALRTFLKLARYVAPDSAGNLQSFLGAVREVVARGGTSELDTFLRTLTMPRALTEHKGVKLTTYNQREAVFHDVVDAVIEKDALNNYVAKAIERSSRVGFLLAYLRAMSPADRSRFAQLIGNAAKCDAVKRTERRGKNPTMASAAPRTARVSAAVAAATFFRFVGRKSTEVSDVLLDRDIHGKMESIEETVGKTPEDGKWRTSAPALNFIDENRTKVADMLSLLLGEDAPVVVALRSDATMAFLRRAVADEAEAEAREKQRPPHERRPVSKMYTKLLDPIAASLGRSAKRGGRIRLVETVLDGLGMLSRGGEGKGHVVTYEEAEAFSVALFTTGESSRGMASLPDKSSRVDSPIATIMSVHGAAQPQTIMRADVDPRRSLDESSVAITSRGVIPLLSRWMDAESGFAKLVTEYFADDVKTDGKDDPAKLEKVLARCRQDMVWPDGTPILAKSISTAYYADEIYDACRQQFVEAGRNDVYLVPVYAGDHSSSVLIQLPRRIIPPEVARKRKELADRYGKGEITRDEMRAERDRDFPGYYEESARFVCRSIGLDLLGNDTKRSALSSLEQAGLSTVGVRMKDDGTLEFGKCTVHIAFNFRSRKNARVAKPGSNGNEELKGTVLFAGYGAERQRQCAKLQGTGTLKCHLMSTGGRDLLFLKSLCISPEKSRGRFLQSDCKQVLFDHISDGLDEISTAVLTDLDSYKVGPAASKWITVNGGKNVLDFIIDTIDADGSLWEGSGEGRSLKLPADFDVDRYFEGKATFDGETRSDGAKPPESLRDLLPGLKISVISGLEGDTIDISYRDDNLTSYSVANVSHESTVGTMRTPRNNVVDAVTMAVVESQLLGDAAGSGLLDLVADWGIAATAICGSQDMVASLAAAAPGLRDLADAGEAPGGALMKEELFRAAWAHMRKQLSMPMNGTDMALVSAGAGNTVLRDKDGNIRYDERGRPMISMLSSSPMMRDINYGSVLFTPDETKKGAVYEGFSRRFGLSAVNVRHAGFRYGWWMDEKGLETFKNQFIDEKARAGATEEDILLALERTFIDLRNAERGGADNTARRLREDLASCFVDHHGRRISDYGDRIMKIGFDDLFLDAGTRFDRSAVQIGDDKVHNMAGDACIFLGGTAFGIPRTPSYNGGPWLQVCRASVPVTEIAVDEEHGIYEVGRDAMVAPDPVTNEILGCDHDGDKTKVYWLVPSGGRTPLLENGIPLGEVDVGEFAGADPAYREEVYGKLRETGFVEESVDPKTGLTTRAIPETVRTAVGNTFVRHLLDMAHRLPVPGRMEDGPRRQSFMDGPVSMPTSAFPGGGPMKDAILGLTADAARPGAKKTLSGDRKLDQPGLAALVSAQANDAADARATIVGYARALHLAYMSGRFADGAGTLFGDGFTPDRWLKFIHFIDGISNATFDDIKEQLCSRLGWTNGMMPSLVVALLTGGKDGGPVTTMAELRSTLELYVKGVNNYGAQYYMMLASDQTDRAGVQGAIDRHLGKTSQGMNRWAAAFGLKERTKDNEVVGWEPVKNSGETAGLTPGEAVTACIGDELMERMNESRPEGSPYRMTPRTAYAALAYAGRSSDAAPGGLLHLLKVAAGVDETDAEGIFGKMAKKDKGTGKVEWTTLSAEEFVRRKPAIIDALAEYLRWHEGNSLLQEAREFGNSFNYLAADPGSSSAVERLRKAADAGAELLSAEDRSERGRALGRMHAATLAAYRIGGGVETLLSRANDLASHHDEYLASITPGGENRDDALRDVSGALAELDAIPDSVSTRMARESAVQTKLFALAAFQSVPGMSPAQVLEMLKAIADAHVEPFVRENMTEREHEEDGQIFRMMRGVAALFDVMYRLATSSTEHYGQARRADGRRNGQIPHSAFSYFVERPDSRFPERSFDGESYMDGGTSADPLYVIQPRFQGDEGPAADLARDAVAQIVEGKAFSGVRARADGNKAGATSFTLSSDNLRRFREEIGDGHPDILAEIDEAIRIVEAVGEVTPQRMFRELLPVYTAIVHRTTGTPTVGGRSLAPLLGVHPAWSRRQVANDDASRVLVDAYLGAETSPMSQTAYAGTGEDGKAKYGRRRANPEYRSVVDVFAGDGVIAKVASRLMTYARHDAETVAAAPALPEGVNPSETARRHAAALQALAGSWATVRWTGNDSFVLEGSLRGGVTSGAPKAARVAICVTVGDMGPVAVESDGQVDALAHSRAYAASFAGTDTAKALGIGSASDFLRLPLDVRRAFVRRYSVGGASANRPAFTVDSTGAKVLVGRIRLDGKAGTRLYHEYFHSMMSMFRALDMFSVADIKALQDTFGKPPAGSGMLFDEEKAAERYRRWVETGTEKDKAAEGVFRRIFNAISRLLRSIAEGFGYKAAKEGEDLDDKARERNEEMLFSFATMGIAARSTSRVAELEASRESGVSPVDGLLNGGTAPGISEAELPTARDIAARLRWPGFQRVELVRTEKGEVRPYVQGETGVKWATRKEAIDFMSRQMMESKEALGIDMTLPDEPALADRSPAKQRYDSARAHVLEVLGSTGAVEADDLRLSLRLLMNMGGDVGGFTDVFETAVESGGALPPVAETSLAVTAGVPPVGSNASRLYSAGRTLAEICTGRMKDELSVDMDMLKAAFGADPSRIAARLVPKARAAIIAGFRDALAVLNPEALKRFSGAKLQDSLAFELLLCAAQTLDRTIVARDSEGAKERAFLRAEGKDPERKWHASRYDVSSWILASQGVEPASIVEDAIKSLDGLAGADDVKAKPAIDTCRSVLDRLRGILSDPDSYVSELLRSTTEIDGLIESFAPGVRLGETDADGALGDYVLAQEGTSENPATDENLKIYGAIDAGLKGTPQYTAVQAALKTTFAALYRARAMMKFHRDLGFVPASKSDLDFARRLQEQGRIVAHQTADEWFAQYAIGASNLLDNEGLVEFYGQPYFTMDNMEAYLASMIRPRFGTGEFGDAVRADGHEYAGIMYDLKDLDNFQAWLLGDAGVAGTELLRPVLKGGRFGVDAGEIKFIGGEGRNVGFDVYSRRGCGLSLTEDELRSSDMFKKALAFSMGRWKDVITGLDHITFRYRDRELPGDWDGLFNVVEGRFFMEPGFRKPDGGQVYLSRYEMTVHRMPHQLHGGILLGGEGGMGFAQEFATAAHDAIERAANAYDELKDKADKGQLTEDERRRYESFDLNAEVIEELEGRGLVIARRKRNGRAYECVVRLGTDRILKWFKGTSAYRKLTSRERWAAVEAEWAREEMARDRTLTQERAEAIAHQRVLDMFEPESLIAPMRALWNRVSRFVREHPWMTQGDAKHLTAFGTPLPYFQGTGVFMHSAVRAARNEARRTHVDSLGHMERRWLAAVTSLANARRIGDAPEGTPEQIRAANGEEHTTLTVFRDLIGARDIELTELKRALIEGDFGPGGKYADIGGRHALELQENPTLAAIHDETYRLMVIRAEMEATGDAPKAPVDLQALIDGYQESGASGLTGGLGCSPAAMYRAYGTLPANHQLGHMVRKAAEGVTNAMAHRATFMTLMMTPAADGAPVYYMRPGERAAEDSGIPDPCWAQIARWWAAYHGLRYDEGQSGVQNARRLYDELGSVASKGQPKGRWKIASGLSDHRYVPLGDDQSDLQSVSGIMCMEDEELGNDSSAINALAKGEAVGYMRQFVDSGRAMGFGPLAVRKGIHHALAWSKSMSVAFSLFFPLATRFESPIGAVGAIPTVMGNLKGGPDFVRKHPELFNSLQKMFLGKGWITKDFIGFRDYMEMMDSRDPFLAEMVSWVHALGLSYSDDLVNPMEHAKSAVVSDLRNLEALMRKAGWAPSVVRRFRSFADAVLVRPGDKAFRYALNATKLAVVSQLAMKLRHEAKLRGKAFDPIRDLRKYASYVNAEVGGIDETRYAWAHPAMRKILNCLFFSWQWTRGAWEAGGGNVIEDFVFGGHSATREERKYILGRWARMYGEIMIGVPLLAQMAVMAFAKAMGGGDDGDDRWFTWQNEEKANLSAFDITPLMKAIHRHEDVAGIVGRIAGAGIGAMKFGALGAVAGLAIGQKLVPDYTGKDQANQTTRNRRYYMHFGKQGWEFFRWFDKPGQQFMGKLSMPAQRLLEGFFGRNLGYLERKLPWDGMGPAERWLNPTLDSATVNLVKAFLPFSVGQFMSFGDAGFLPIMGPVQMGASQTAIQKRLEEAVDAWARNDRTAYSWGIYRAPKKGKAKRLAGMFSDILEDARRNGLDPEQQLNTALGTVARNYYGRLFSLLPDEPDGEYDVKAVERVCRALNRILTRKASVLQSAEKKLEKQGRPLDRMDPAMRTRLRRIIGRHLADPFAGEMEPAAEPPTREEY